MLAFKIVNRYTSTVHGESSLLPRDVSTYVDLLPLSRSFSGLAKSVSGGGGISSNALLNWDNGFSEIMTGPDFISPILLVSSVPVVGGPEDTKKCGNRRPRVENPVTLLLLFALTAALFTR